MAEDCVFCRIIAGTEPATVVRRWPYAIAIVPLNPVVDGHLLVMPREHVRDATVDPHVTAVAARAAADLAVAPCNIITSAGWEATQSVPHLHWHVVPRRENDGLALPWHPGRRSLTPAEVGAQIHIVADGGERHRTAGFAAGLQQGYYAGRRDGGLR